VISFLLDTHILVWWLLGVKRLTAAQSHVLKDIESNRQSVALSAMSLRELAKLIQDRWFEVDATLEAWLDVVESHPLISVIPITAKVAAESVKLGADFPRDPADQIIVATARCHGLTLITADDAIRKWGRVSLL